MAGKISAVLFSLLLGIALIGGGNAAAEPPDHERAVASFSEKLFETVRSGGKENIVVSPLSVYVALAMAASGSDGETAEQFACVLGLEASEMQKMCLALIQGLNEEVGNTTLRMANSIWVDDKLEITGDYKKLLQQYYLSECHSLDLKSEAAPDEINAWIAEKTEGLIADIIREINPEAAMVLVNSLYMNAAWQSPFVPERTEKALFRCADGTNLEADFMTKQTNLQYYFRTDSVEGMALPYEGGRFAFLAVKPNDGDLSGLRLDGGTVRGWMEAMEERRGVQLSLPKFKNRYTITLNDALKAMGLTAAFENPDFSRMIEGMSGIGIDSVLHEALMRVDEQGTEAAAGTAVIMGQSAVLGIYPLQFDSPFVYAVIDLKTGVPLFLGAMDSPVPA